KSLDEWEQFSDGERVLPILRTIPEKVIGPGHNSIIRGPNNRELYCVYHRWTENGRVMAIDRMDFAGRRIFIVGATDTPQIKPYEPNVSDLFPGRPLFADAGSKGRWKPSNDGIESAVRETCERVYSTRESFICETTFRCLEWKGEKARLGFRLADKNGIILEISIKPVKRTGTISFRTNGTETVNEFFLPLDFILAADHLFRAEADGTKVKVSIDATAVAFETRCRSAIRSLSILSQRTTSRFAALTITDGFEDLFESDDENPETNGWRILGLAAMKPTQREGELLISTERGCSVTKGELFDAAEYAANIRMVNNGSPNSDFGLQLLDRSDSVAVRFGCNSSGFYVDIPGAKTPIEMKAFAGFDASVYHQFRMIKLPRKLIAMLDSALIAEVDADLPATRISIFCTDAAAATDMARVTSIRYPEGRTS
ncbi:MAG TPA: hypothetical protein VK468_07330, partial [Pyrinomonadaceae bacterium]|nr:hypothetical protein [Pyrinomonadaceae bacterium]